MHVQSGCFGIVWLCSLCCSSNYDPERHTKQTLPLFRLFQLLKKDLESYRTEPALFVFPSSVFRLSPAERR